MRTRAGGFEVLRREGPGVLPAIVRDADGALLRLTNTPPGRMVGTIGTQPVYASLVEAWTEDTAPSLRGSMVLTLDADAVDEVRVHLGPEVGGGLFDRTASEDATDVEATATAGRIPRPGILRTAVLARVAAWRPAVRPDPMVVFPSDDALARLARAAREEPPDALPMPASPMAWGPPATRAAHARVTQATHARVRPARNFGRTAVFAALGALLAYLTWRLLPPR